MNRIDSLSSHARETSLKFWREAGRRASLARQPRPEGVRGPPFRLFLDEVRTLAQGRMPRRRMEDLPRHLARTPGPVMVLPGFGASPQRMRRMVQGLSHAGHHAHGWGLGANLGPTPHNFAFLLARVEKLSRRYRQPVALVGWSLGGLFAREIARRIPEHVSCVITLGTPFSGDPRANNGWRAYQLVTGHAVDAPPIEVDFSAKPPVPTVAIWSPRDGVISPRSACGWPSERDRAVALRCNHMGFATSREAIGAVLRQLDDLP